MKRLPEELYGKLKKVLESPFHVAILTHINPDGDAIGSILGLYWFLIKRGCTVSLATPNQFPHYLKWMEGSERILDFSKDPEQVSIELKKADLVFCLDFNEPGRLGGIQALFEELDVMTILVDHHPDPLDMTDYIISDTQASSTAELVYQMICDLDGQDIVDKRIAECLYAGIMTDTGCFSFNSSNPGTFGLVGELLQKGLDKDRIFSLVYDNYSIDRMRLLGFSLKEKMVVISELRTAYISLSTEELIQFNHRTGDTEGFVNYPFNIGDVRVSALFLEREDHIKISFRSKGNFKINQFAAKYFNGGGHMNAAGGEYHDSLENTLRHFEEMIVKYADEISALA